MLDKIKLLFNPVVATLNFIQNYFKSLVFLLVVYLIFGSGESSSYKTPNLMKIELKGPIMDSMLVLEQIKLAKEDTNIKGVLFDVDSPGGAVAPSIEIAYAIKELNQIKPVIAYAGGTMASGSYYASIWANEIVANPGSMIGSVGVIFQSADISKLAEKFGVKYQVIKAGKYKEMGTPFKSWEQFEKQELQNLIQETYELFVTDVSNARKLDPRKHEEFADARVFNAASAKKVGLIDTVGTLQTAQNILITKSKVTNPVWQEEDKMEKLMNKFISETAQLFVSSFSGLQSKSISF